ncbi:uncharacterized protein LOC129582218 [Paramacrobiotus metropolitanus]|uniref:uncharacterized protein LOC129582218 n=1 Tax=Paramacrobiotus metropolitanus TaxID=2943436 RepID=UPI00244656FC|nr:uncharacterized protein LOC129582218 [Paramacrobiotus metropolitanus]
MNKFVMLTFVAVCVLVTVLETEAKPKHCTWHGTAPLCMPSCPSGKKKIPGTESKCGPNTVACCVTNKKFVCCPNDWQGNAANAMAIAKE